MAEIKPAAREHGAALALKNLGAGIRRAVHPEALPAAVNADILAETILLDGHI